MKPTEEAAKSPVSTSVSHRPFTRSQTGYVPKRRRRDDSPPAAVVHRARSLPRKKRKSSANTPSEDLLSDSPPEPNLSGPTSICSASEVSSLQPDLTVPIPNITQFSFIPESSSSTTASTPNTPSDRRGPRSRVVLPLPVPNLTKKSRGRRVPIQDGTAISSISDTDTKDVRMYVCKVESCRKCFHRGEHLKRHIRSIHTHEKRESGSCQRYPTNLPRRFVFKIIQHSSAYMQTATNVSTGMTTYYSTSRSTKTLRLLRLHSERTTTAIRPQRRLHLRNSATPSTKPMRYQQAKRVGLPRFGASHPMPVWLMTIHCMSQPQNL